MSHQQSVLNPSKGWELKTKQLWTWERSPSHTGKQPELDSIWNGEPYFDSTSCSWASSPVMAGPITIRIEYYFIPTCLLTPGVHKRESSQMRILLWSIPRWSKMFESPDTFLPKAYAHLFVVGFLCIATTPNRWGCDAAILDSPKNPMVS